MMRFLVYGMLQLADFGHEFFKAWQSGRAFHCTTDSGKNHIEVLSRVNLPQSHIMAALRHTGEILRPCYVPSYRRDRNVRQRRE